MSFRPRGVVMSRGRTIHALATVALLFATGANGEVSAEDDLDREFNTVVRQLVQRYCHECHAGDVIEADVDLAAFETPAAVRRHTKVWLKVREMLDTGQMPPKDSPTPTEDEKSQLQLWVRTFLAREAQTHAGDPGPIALRRLNNAEYTYAVQDLTGVATLEPTQEFPVDGAAGEGFINVGSGQGMSPALIQKYLDAAKRIAEHAVLLPEGIRFSSETTPRDHTDQASARIQAFYRRFTADGGGTGVNLQGIQFETNQGGLLPVERYLSATLVERTALLDGTKTVAQVAAERSLNEKYLSTLWTMLTRPADNTQSLLLDSLRTRWQTRTVDDAAAMAGEIAVAQQGLWKFNSIGHIGRDGGPTRWLEPVSLLTANQELRLKLPDPAANSDVVFYLSAHELNDGNRDDFVVWKNPRLEFKADESGAIPAPILLKDLQSLSGAIAQTIRLETDRTPQYLNAVRMLASSEQRLSELAEAKQLNPQLLESWQDIIGLNARGSRKVTGHFTEKMEKVGGYAGINGWGSAQTPSILSNQTDQPVVISTLTVPPRGVVVHPSPKLESVVAWRSPIVGKIRIEALIADADDKCGNGAAWRIELQTETGVERLAEGQMDNGGKQSLKPDRAFDVASGDVLRLVVNPRDQNHSCDTTHIELNVSEIGDENRKWNLAHDIVDHILEANPLPDSYGHAEVWHFCSAADEPQKLAVLPPDSALARWKQAVADQRPDEEIEKLSQSVLSLLTSKAMESLAEPDRLLRQRIRNWHGPMRWRAASEVAEAPVDAQFGLDEEQFGKHPQGAALAPADLCRQAPQVIEIRLPAALAFGAEFVTTAVLDPTAGTQGSVQVQMLTKKRAVPAFSPVSGILIQDGSATQQRLAAEIDEYRQLFPPALCYSRIVPVDEVVTLTLFYREDNHLKRLMLDERQAAELDRLWDELFFISREPLQLAVAYEQLVEFATQDRPDLVKAFASLKEPITLRAEKFRQRLVDAEPAQLHAAIAFADSAWRRPATESERRSLTEMYDGLRAAEVPHEAAVRLILARILTSPEFLYKLEQPPPGAQAAAVNPRELASRLSFFLWSSWPDEALRAAADDGRLSNEAALLEETHRLLRDPRARRLAVQFACQWLHVRDFDKQNDKNESLFPEFAGLRGDIYEETVRFFEDMFRNNGSILDVLDADHTFANGNLARHYGLDNAPANEWRRLDGMRAKGRGGILGMATILASQSGASRTSPILRGNWVYETLLGERLPRPPAGVPILPETVPEGLTERQLIERHSSVAACAKCHAKIDPYGFALEQYDAIGRLRPTPVNTKTTLPGGREIEGLAGLREYLVQVRRDDFVNQFCKKLLGYALGRETQLSDEPLLSEMQAKLAAGEFRFQIAVDAIVTSPQFQRIRGRDFTDD